MQKVPDSILEQETWLMCFNSDFKPFAGCSEQHDLTEADGIWGWTISYWLWGLDLQSSTGYQINSAKAVKVQFYWKYIEMTKNSVDLI